MRVAALAILFLPAVVVGRLFEDDAYLQDSADGSGIARASPASVPTSGSPMATSVAIEGMLELRQAPAPAAPQNPGLAPVNNPVPAAAPAPNVAAVAPVAPALTMTSTLPANTQDFISVQWVETWIGGTSQTWVPKTITFHFEPVMSQAPLPGKGEIGMGTLTGEPGHTKTIVVAAAAAPTNAARWMSNVVAAVGVGVVGVMI